MKKLKIHYILNKIIKWTFIMIRLFILEIKNGIAKEEGIAMNENGSGCQKKVAKYHFSITIPKVHGHGYIHSPKSIKSMGLNHARYSIITFSGAFFVL